MKERDDFEPSNSNSDLEPVASHSVCVQNNIEQIVTDDEIDNVWGSAKFGSISKRDVIIKSLQKYTQGYHSGKTADSIMKELGLVNSQNYLTAKGLKYLLLHSGQEAQECDTTEVKSMGSTLAQNNTPVKEDWISVEDRLPSKEDTCDDFYNEVLTLQLGSKRPAMMKYWEVKNSHFVKYWMPLPPPPTNLINKPL